LLRLLVHTPATLTKLSTMANIAGTYVHDKDDNLKEFLDRHASNYLISKVMAKSSPTVVVSVSDDGDYHIQTKTALKTLDWEFKLDEEVNLETPDGEKAFIFTMDGDKMVQTPVGDDAPRGMKITREFCDQGMCMTLENEDSGMKAHRYFKRQ